MPKVLVLSDHPELHSSQRLIEEIKKKDLEAKAGISHYTMNKLTKGENVTIDTLGKICKALDCAIEDIVEFIEN